FVGIPVSFSKAPYDKEKECISVGLIGEFKNYSSKANRIFGEEISRGIEIGKIYLNSNSRNNCFKFTTIDIDKTVANTPGLIKKHSQNGIHLYIGLGLSDQALMASDALRENNSVLISPTASSRDLVNNKKIILLYPTNDLIAQKMAQEAYKKGARNVLSVYLKNNSYSVNMAKNFRIEFEKLGGRITKEIIIRHEEGSLFGGNIFSEISKYDFTHIFVPLYELDVAKFITQAFRNHLVKKYIATDSWGTHSTTIKGLIEKFKIDVIIPRIYDYTSSFYINKFFMDEFTRKYSILPSDLSAFSFESVLLANALVHKCGTDVKNWDVFVCLKKTAPFASTSGHLTLFGNNSFKRKFKIETNNSWGNDL
ncbi:MAG: amino acid ABC transporter substrate-binding protein, partial [Oligoflexia bacterium]|nr:amino acid ABC transporter substrate-binding protein [Oligoflexia bacterium]